MRALLGGSLWGTESEWRRKEAATAKVGQQDGQVMAPESKAAGVGEGGMGGSAVYENWDL